MGIERNPEQYLSQSRFERREKKQPKPIECSSLVTNEYIFELVRNNNKTCFLRFDRSTQEITEWDRVALPSLSAPMLPHPANSTYLSACSWPTCALEYGTDKDLINLLREFIHKWVEVSENDELIMVFYVLFTHSYDEFLEVTYLRFIGDLGSGKSRAGNEVMGSLVYKGIRTTAVSSIASLFRILHVIKGTLFLDEADLGDRSDKTSEIVQVLNSGYRAGNPVLRVDTNKVKNMEPVEFHVFGPKIIMSREHMKDQALESRCIPIHMKEKTRREIPLLLNRSLESEAQELRNKLLLWRFRNYGTHEENIDQRYIDLAIASRTKQLFMLLSSVVYDKEVRDMMLTLAVSLSVEQKGDRGESRSGEVLEIMRTMLLTTAYEHGEKIFLSFNDMVKNFNASKSNNEAEKKMTNHWMSNILREKLKMKKHKLSNARGVRFTIQEFNIIADKYDIEPLPEENAGISSISELQSLFNPEIPPV